MTTPVVPSGEVLDEPPPIESPSSSITIVTAPVPPVIPDAPRPNRTRGKAANCGIARPQRSAIPVHSPNPWVAIPGVLISGCSFELGLIQVQTRLQQLAPVEMRGRVLSVNGLAFNGVMPLATFTISSASVVLGLPVVMGICAAVLAV